MTSVAHAELLSVGPDEVVVTFTSEPGERVTTRLGDHEVVTEGPFHHAVIGGLTPDTEYAIAVEGYENDGRWLPASARTLVQPSGRLLATIATANDVHFGETECGKTGEPVVDAIGPVLSSAPGEPPYPEMMGSAIVDEMLALGPDAVVVKGDLTDSGREEEYAAFLACYGRLGARLHHVRGNHDAMRDPNLARNGSPFSVDVNGVTLVVLDTVVPGRCGGALDAAQREFIDEVAGATSGPVLLFAHHPLSHWDLDYCIDPPDADALVDVLARRPNVVASLAGHTHSNRLVRDERVPEVPFAEVNCAKDFPGAWAEYRVYEGGVTQVLRRVQRPDARAWSERGRHMIQGYYRDLVFGDITDRCFTRTW
ncbi:MAG: metallophosphoesterase [Acidimicrobiia bacterium]